MKNKSILRTLISIALFSLIVIHTLPTKNTEQRVRADHFVEQDPIDKQIATRPKAQTVRSLLHTETTEPAARRSALIRESKETEDLSEEPSIEEEKDVIETEQTAKTETVTPEKEPVVEKETVKPKKETPEPKPEPAKPSYTTHAHSGDYMSTVPLNIRSGPGAHYPSVGVLNPHQKASVSEKAKFANSNTDWYKVSINGISGWSSSAYLVSYKEQPKPKPAEKKAPAKSTNTSNYQPMRIYFNGTSVGYKNGGRANGQAIIDSSNYASTWGGAPFSGTDGQNTHFIGHSPGNFTGIQNASSFVVTDSNGKAFRYNVTKVYRVNEKGVDSSGNNHWDRIVGTGGGERITIQTCVIGASNNWIIEASPAN